MSAAALAEGIACLLEDPERLERAREAARRSAQRFGREVFGDASWVVFRG